MELFSADKSLTMDEILDYKYDMRYSESSAVAYGLNVLKGLGPQSDPLVDEALSVLRKWDLSTEPENMQAALGVLTFHGRKPKRLIFNADSRPDVEDLLISLKHSASLLIQHHGVLEIPWKSVNRLVRGNTDLGLGGGPDILHAVYGEVQEDGRAMGTAGDSHIWTVKWNGDGSMETQSIQPFGSAATRPESPHYADQAHLFVNRELKTLWFSEEDVLANSQKSYFPGQE